LSFVDDLRWNPQEILIGDAEHVKLCLYLEKAETIMCRPSKEFIRLKDGRTIFVDYKHDTYLNGKRVYIFQLRGGVERVWRRHWRRKRVLELLAALTPADAGAAAELIWESSGRGGWWPKGMDVSWCVSMAEDAIDDVSIPYLDDLIRLLSMDERPTSPLKETA
jgi:hypothetical protein